jgi:hypothetical protein
MKRVNLKRHMGPTGLDMGRRERKYDRKFLESHLSQLG